VSEEHPETKYAYGDMRLPLLYENDDILVFRNLGGQIFIKDKRSDAIIQVSACLRGMAGLEFVIRKCTLEPVSVNGEHGMRIIPR
jgi:hypothetical protein